MRILITTDIEGVAGVVHPDQTRPGNADYERARRLIRQGMHFADVAQATGFTDQSHFTNTFKHFMGATPGQYAAASSLAFNRE